MVSEHVDISELLEKLKLKLDASLIAVFLSSERYFTTDEALEPNIWQSNKHLKQPEVINNTIIVPILRKKSLRIFLRTFYDNNCRLLTHVRVAVICWGYKCFLDHTRRNPTEQV